MLNHGLRAPRLSPLIRRLIVASVACALASVTGLGSHQAAFAAPTESPAPKFRTVEAAGWADCVGEYVVVVQGGPGGRVQAGTSRFQTVLGGTALMETTELVGGSILRIYRFDATADVVHVWTTIDDAPPSTGSGSFSKYRMTTQNDAANSPRCVMDKSADRLEVAWYRCASEMGTASYRRR